MPVCNKCGKMQASAELRKSRKAEGGYVCKDVAACTARQARRQ